MITKCWPGQTPYLSASLSSPLTKGQSEDESLRLVQLKSFPAHGLIDCHHPVADLQYISCLNIPIDVDGDLAYIDVLRLFFRGTGRGFGR